MISRSARTEVRAGAIRVSWLTGWPSARTEIQEVSVARMTRARELGVFSDGARFDGARFDFCEGGAFCEGGTLAWLLPAPLSLLLAELLADEGAEAGASAGG